MTRDLRGKVGLKGSLHLRVWVLEELPVNPSWTQGPPGFLPGEITAATRWRCRQKTPGQRRRLKRPGFHPWVGKMPWRRAWQPTPVFLPKGSQGQRSLAGCSHTESDTTDVT